MMLLMRQFWLSAFCFTYAVASFLFSDGLVISNFVIVSINNCYHIWHAAIAHIYGISVKYLMELLVRWKMIIL